MQRVIISNPATVAEAWEMLCPGCSRDDSIRIKAIVTVSLHRHGTDPTESDTEWDDASIAFCNRCGYTGNVKDFSEAYSKLHNNSSSAGTPDAASH